MLNSYTCRSYDVVGLGVHGTDQRSHCATQVQDGTNTMVQEIQQQGAYAGTGRAEGDGGVDVEAGHPLEKGHGHEELVQLVGGIPQEGVYGHSKDNFAKRHQAAEREEVAEVVELDPRTGFLGVPWSVMVRSVLIERMVIP